MSSRNTRRGQQADDELQQGAEPAQGHPMQPAPAGGAAGTGWGLAIPPGANPPMPNPMPPPPAGAMMPPLPTFPAGEWREGPYVSHIFTTRIARTHNMHVCQTG